jgi:drug/metabolite transporter (DMT)-like permease
MTYVYLLLTAFIWAAVFHLGKYALTVMSPLSLASWRFIIAGIALSAWLSWQRGWQWRAIKRNAKPLIIMGIVGIFGFNAALFTGLARTSPINGALIMAFYPAITAVLSTALNGEHIVARQWLGFVLSVFGIVAIISNGSLGNLLAMHVADGDLLVLLGCLCWAIYSVIPARFVRDIPTLQLTTATIVVGAVVLTIAAAVSTHDLLTIPAPSIVLSVLCISLLGTVLAYLWWNRGLQRIGASRVAIFINAVPVFTALIGVALGQPMSAAQIVGAILVIAGVLISSRSQQTS